MLSTTASRQGDVVLVTFPFTDLTSTKRRPAVVVSPDAFNARNEDVVLVAMTSQTVRDLAAVSVGRGDVTDGALPKDSTVRLGRSFHPARPPAPAPLPPAERPISLVPS